MTERHGERRPVPVTEPAPVITEKARTADWVLRAGTNANDASRAANEPAPTLRFGARLNDVSWVSNDRPNAAVRNADEPAPTITGGHDHGERQWVTQRPAPTLTTTRRSDQGLLVGRQLAEGEGRNVGGHGWDTTQRPSTTVNGDPRISEPGHHDAEVSGSQQANAVRVTLAEALVLQSFPPDYPVQGSKTAQYEQVGNAVPPLLAWHVLRAVAGEIELRQAA